LTYAVNKQEKKKKDIKKVKCDDGLDERLSSRKLWPCGSSV